MVLFKCFKDVKDRVIQIAQDPSRCSNATVIDLCFKFTQTKGRKKIVAFTQLAHHLCSTHTTPALRISLDRLPTKIKSAWDVYNALLKHIERSEAIEDFLSEEFQFPKQVEQAACASPPHSPLKESSSELVCAPVVTTPVKTRGDCFKCSSTKKANVSLQRTLKAEKSKHFQLKSFTANIKKNLNIKGQKQKLSRHAEKISRQKGDVQNLKIKLQDLTRRNTKLRNHNDNLSKDVKKLARENSALKKELDELKGNFRQKHQDLIENKKYCDYLELRVKDYECGRQNRDEDRLINCKDGKAYTGDVRRLIYAALTCDVPVKHCGYLFSKFVEVLCEKTPKHVPGPSTCAQMAYELGTITTIQLMEYLLNHGRNKNICLSWDATTVEGCHVNEVHLTVDRNSCLVLDVRHLPGGKTSDYVEHIVSALTEATDVYARFTQTEPATIFNALKRAITCTLTDRAAVNGCVTRQLCDELDSQLVQLNCNVHPLDSIARYAKKSLVELDQRHGITGSCYGSEGTAANLINAVSVLRFKDGTGDPVGFKSMLRQHNLPVGTFPRYVGNRIHVLFHLAGVLVLHWSKLNNFLQFQSTAGGLLRTRLLKDLVNEKIMAQVWALGIMGKIFSGPWMTKFYSSEMSNLDMRPLVQNCEKQLMTWIGQPQSLLHPSANVFGEDLDPEDEVMSSLLTFMSGEVDIQVEAISTILKSSLTVLQRQLKDFLMKGQLPEGLADKVSSAPTHNMASERALGSYDKMMRRAPVATGGFLNGKVRSKMNKCTQWLDKKSTADQAQIISFAVKEARGDRARKHLRDREVEEEISRRRVEIASERKHKNKSAAKKSIAKALKTKSVADLKCGDNLKDRVLKFIEDSDALIGQAFIHTIDHTDYYGRVNSTNEKETVIGYWGFMESESSSVDYSIDITSFFADAILGSIVFM